MLIRYNYLINIFLFLSVTYPCSAWVITPDEIANKCKSNEKNIKDISLEYEWYIIPPYTPEELKQKTGGISVGVHKDGVMKCKLQAGRFVDPNGRNRWRYVFEDASTIIIEGGKSWDSIVRYSYDGRVCKKLTVTVGEADITLGLVTSDEDELDSGVPLGTPIGFSIFRFESYPLPEHLPLSITLKQSEDEKMIRLIDSLSKVNDFNVIRVDLLSKLNNLPWTHIYFSIDHNYAPVKYEAIKNAKTGELAYTVEVHSLEQIGDGLWFPTSGTLSAPDDIHVNAFQVMGKILANQGLEEKDFDIEFPAGTKVRDQIAKKEYVVGEERK